MVARSPFVVFSLPRSRSAWLSTFLGAGHDVGAECTTPEGFAGKVASLGGSCETGAAFAWPVIRDLMPDAKFVVVLRDPGPVANSLARFGLTGYLAEMMRRREHLERIAELPGVLTVQFDDLSQPDTCEAIWDHCMDDKFDPAWFERLNAVNVQVDMGQRLARLSERRDNIAALKAAVARRLPGYQIEIEPWGPDLWADMEPLTEAHALEVDGGVEPRRPFKVDQALMGQLAQTNVLWVITARISGELVGYFTWNVSLDVESQGLLIGQQGAWYVSPGHPGVAGHMFDKSVQVLKRLGVSCIYPHHRTQGRGAAIGRFFERRGAKHIQQNYSLWIGD